MALKRSGYPVNCHISMFMEWKWGADHLEMRRVDRGSFPSLYRLAIERNSYGVSLLGIHIAYH